MRGIAVLAGVVGLVGAAALVGADVTFAVNNLFGTIGLGDLPFPYTLVLLVRLAVAVVLVVGAIGAFRGSNAGAVTLAVGGVLGVLAVLSYPYQLGAGLLPDGFGVGEYVSLLFRFPHAEFVFVLTALFASGLTLVLAPAAATMARRTGVLG
jgi:hypothetical protein